MAEVLEEMERKFKEILFYRKERNFGFSSARWEATEAPKAPMEPAEQVAAEPS
jgi:hypothetical protein